MKTEDVISIALASGLYQDDEMFFSPSTGEADVHISNLEYFAKLVEERTLSKQKAGYYQEGYEAGQHDMFTKSQNVDTFEERVHESDISIHDLRAAAEMALEALITAQETTEYQILYKYFSECVEQLLQALAQPEPWDTSDMAHRSGGLSVEQEPVAWRNAAIRLGEDLYSVSPDGYYDMTAKQWLDWALSVVTAPPSKPWVSLTDEEITGAAHNEAKHPVSILGTTDSGLCMKFSETGEWHASDKHGDFMKVNGFLMSFARAIGAALRSKNDTTRLV